VPWFLYTPNEAQLSSCGKGKLSRQCFDTTRKKPAPL